MINALLIIGITLLAGLYSSLIFKKLGLPQVMGQMAVGIALGLSGFKLLNVENIHYFSYFTELALGIIGFVIGGELRWSRLKKLGISILSIAFFESVFTCIFVFIPVYLLTKDLALSMILGSLSAATAPGGTTQIIQEYRTRGPVTSTLFGVVGADDAFAIMIFTFAYNISKSILISQNKFDFVAIAGHAIYEILGAIAIGLIMGLIFTVLGKKLKSRDGKQLFTLAMVLIASGIAINLQVSLILSTMFLGIFVGNYNPHASRSYFNSLEQLTPPIYILFFVLIGANFRLSILPTIGVIGIVYIIFRSAGKIFGAWFGASISKANTNVRRYLGFCLLSQAGVQLGLAIAAQNELIRLSEHLPGQDLATMGIYIVNIITGTTLVFQVIGPMLAKKGLELAGEIRAEKS